MNNPENLQFLSQRYSLISILLHWITVVLLVTIATIGWYMSDLPNGAKGQEFLYQLHKSLGISVLFLTIGRISWRLMNPPPPFPKGLSELEKLVASSVHIGFYVLLFAIPVSGWIYVSTAQDFKVPTVLFGLISWPHLPLSEVSGLKAINEASDSAHSALVWATGILLILHVAGAVKHHFSNEGGVMHRMLSANKSPIPIQRVAIAVAVPALIFVSITLCSNTVHHSNQKSQNVTDSGKGNWVVDYDNSEIRFSGVHDGSDFSGTFENWSAEIQFNENNLEQSSATVLIQSASAKTGSRLYDDTLISSEWFNASDHPLIRVSVNEIRAFQNLYMYSSRADIQLKDVQLAVAFLFDLHTNENNADMIGQAILYRNELNLGQLSDANNDWVSNKIIVDIKLSATRKK